MLSKTEKAGFIVFIRFGMSPLTWLHHPPLADIPVFLQSHLQSPSGLPNVELQAIRYTTLDCLPRGDVSLTLVNFEQRVCPDLKTTLMLNFPEGY